MILDLTKTGNLPKEKLGLFRDTAMKTRKDYNNIIYEIGEINKNDYRWWFSELASRNVFSDNLFLHLCYLAFIEEILKQGESIEIIIVDSYSLKKTLMSSNKIVTRNIKIGFRISLFNLPKSILAPFWRYYSISYRLLSSYIIIKKIYKEKRQIPKGICLIDTFVFDHSFKENNFTDRYFGKFINFFSEEEKKTIWYITTFNQIKSYKKTIGEIQKANQNFIIKEYYLKWVDIIKILYLPLKMLSIKIGKHSFLSFDVESLVKQAKILSFATSSQIESFKNYHFAKRIKEKGIEIKTVVDWFENQTIDKGFNMGFRKFFPEAMSKGYQIVQDNKLYTYYYPTQQELINKVLPNEIFVSGKGFVQSIKEFCPELKVGIAPSFRYEHVWEERIYSPDNNHYTILLALPYFKKDAINILKISAKTLKKLNNPKLRFYVKPHPRFKEEQLKKSLNENWPTQFQLVYGKLEDLLEKSNLVITSNSSLCLEVVAKSIPIIVIGNYNGITHNPLPEFLDKRIWRLCYSSLELIKSILYFVNLTSEQVKEIESIGVEFRELYFEPVTKETTRLLFGYGKTV